VAHFADGIDLPIRPFGAPDVHPAHWWFTPRRGGSHRNRRCSARIWRELELLVEARFTPVEAIHIFSANGANWLGESNRIGTLAPGMQADLVVIHGNAAVRISDIEKVDMVFKDGVAYDSAQLIESVRGSIGLH
jgi:predicted amidohydrolase YtcJ